MFCGRDVYIMKKSILIKISALVLCFLTLTVFLSSCGRENVDRDSEFQMVQGVDALNESEEKEYILLSFEGLGVKPFVIEKNVFGAIPIAIGAILALAYAFLKSRQEKIKLGDFALITVFGIIGGIIGSRIFYVMTSNESFKGRMFDFFRFFDGGSIYGAIIGGALLIAISAKALKIKTLKAFDMSASAFMLGQIVGRWCDFFNGASYGYEIKPESSFYWLRMGIYPHINSEITALETRIAYVHPTFLYESIWNLLGFALINIFYTKKKKIDGQIFFMYIAWYGLGRTVIELFRADSGTISASLIIACLSFFGSVAFLIYGIVIGKKKKLETEEYESAYPLFGTKFARKNSKNLNKEEEKNNEID